MTEAKPSYKHHKEEISLHPVHEISWQGKPSPELVIHLKFYCLSFFPFSFSNTGTGRQKGIPEILLLCRGQGAEWE